MKRHNLKQAIWGHIWQCTVGKSLKNATSVNMQPSIQAFWGLIGKKRKKHPAEKSNKCNQFDFACWINQLGPEGPQLEVGAWVEYIFSAARFKSEVHPTPYTYNTTVLHPSIIYHLSSIIIYHHPSIIYPSLLFAQYCIAWGKAHFLTNIYSFRRDGFTVSSSCWNTMLWVNRRT